ncbi:MAG TPA: PAS domain S-box protein [Terriglobales bacterium]|nr:PAS domain S-box protein [Terriglobales bacterium]
MALLKTNTQPAEERPLVSGPTLDAQLMATVFHACNIPIAVVERGCIVLANDAFARLFAYGEKKHVIGQRLAELLPAEHPCTLGAWEHAGMVNGGSGTRCGESHCVFNARRRDGSFARMESSCAGIHHEGRELLVISARDISVEERRAVQREPEKRFRAMFDWAAVGIAQVGLDGKFREANRALETMLGYGRGELRDMRFTQITHPSDLAGDLKLFEELIVGRREHYHLEKRYVRKDGGTIWGHLTVSLVRSPAGEPEFAIGMVEDITERKVTERELQEAQKMEAVGRLVGGVAHDFNNLLTAITLYSDLLLATFGPNAPQRRHGTEIRMAADRGAALIQQLLGFVRRQPPQPEKLAVDAVVDDMEDMLGRLIGEQVELKTEVQPELWPVKMDCAELQQIILNLVLNGRDAIAENGTVTIRTRNAYLDPVQGRAEPGGGPCVEIAVQDTGCGMDAETRAHLFEPFFTTKPKGKGNGLGLATVQRIVQQNRGTIEVESEPGSGTTVRVLLPAEVSGGQEKTAERRGVQQSLGHETVLLVEDEAAVRESMRSILAQNGYSVIEARNGQEALNIARDYKGDIDLLVTDLVLPGKGGREVARDLRELRPQTRVLYISGYSQEARAHAGEGEAVFQKPFTGEALARKVREALDQEAQRK